MLTRNDLDEAVRSGIITAAQAESLAALPTKRHDARQAMTLRDERFVFMRSFNEFFIALGVVLLGVGLTTAGSGETPFAVAMSWAFPIIVWGLAEYLTAIKRYTLPSIVLAVLFTFAVVMLAGRYAYLLPTQGTADLDFLRSFLHGDSLVVCLALFFASLAFYLRFRLPFSLLLIVGSSIPLILMIVNRAVGLPDKGVLNIALLVIGLVVFAVALRFDMSDRERLTRRSDCAFWLMLAAAPLIVHPVVSLHLLAQPHRPHGQCGDACRPWRSSSLLPSSSTGAPSSSRRSSMSAPASFPALAPSPAKAMHCGPHWSSSAAPSSCSASAGKVRVPLSCGHCPLP